MYVTPTALTQFSDYLHFDEDVVVYDCETTGLSPVRAGSKAECHIIQLSAIRLPHLCVGGFGEPIGEREWYIRAVEAIPDRISDMTGITRDFLADKPDEDEVFPEIRDFFRDAAVCGYNNNDFDDLFMDEMYKRHGERFAPFLSLDMYKVSKMMLSLRQVSDYKLPTVAAYHGFTKGPLHDSTENVSMTLGIMKKYAEELDRREAETGSMIPSYSTGVKVRVTGLSRYERGRLRRIYVNTASRDVAFFMDVATLEWKCKDRGMSTDRFNMPDMISQALRLARAKNERELAQYGKAGRRPA